MPPRPLTRLRKLCLALPEAREVEAWGEPTFRVKTIFAMYAGPSDHHGAGRTSVWVKANKTNQMLMLAAAPDRFFVPPYVGPFGWIGVYLDSAKTDWDELEDLLRDAWRMSVPKKLLAAHESTATDAKATTRKPTTRKSTTRKEATPKATAAKGRRRSTR